MNLDICMVIDHRYLSLAYAPETLGHGSIPLLEENTEVPFRLLVFIDGGTRGDFAPLEAYLNGTNFEWKMLHELQPVHYQAAITQLLLESKAPHIAVIPGNVLVQDPSWYGKMQLPYTKDPTCMVVLATQTVMNTLPPSKLAHNDHPAEPMFLTNKVGKTLTIGEVNLPPEEYAQEISKAAHAFGGTRWSAPAVRRTVFKVKPHVRLASKKVGA